MGMVEIMQKLTINFIMCNPDLSGGVRIVADHAHLLLQAGHKVQIIGVDTLSHTPRSVLRSLVKDGRLPSSHICTDHFDEAGVPIRMIKRKTGPLVNDIPDADITIATWWETAEWIEKLPASKGKKVYFIQGYEPFFQGVKDPRRVEETYRLPYSQIGVCRWLCDEIHKVRGADFAHGPCTLVENGIDLARFNAPERGKQPVPTLGYMYSSATFKNPDLAIATLHGVKRDHPQTRFMIFGSHDPVNGHDFPKDTTFIKRPAQSLIPTLYASCDAWLLSSDHEGFGLPIVEAMACRTPVISTHAGIAMEVVSDATGRIVEERSPEALAKAVIEVLSLPEKEWRNCSENARIMAQKFTWARASHHFENALLKAAGNHDTVKQNEPSHVSALAT